MSLQTRVETAHPARHKLLAAGMLLIRTKGYAATTVDELCAAADVTKGAFFHHFKSKDAFGVAVADQRQGPANSGLRGDV